jgi:iron(II)-dependent oxidoreductase
MDLHVGEPLSAPEIAELLSEARARTLLLVAPLSAEDLRVQHSPLMSPILWDLGHIAHFEEVWLLEKPATAGGAGDGEGLRGIYNPFENPRSTRSELRLPGRAECLAYLASVRRAVLEHLDGLDADPTSALLRQGFVFRMVLQHEYQHNETILQTLQLKTGTHYPAFRAVAPPTTVDPDAPDPGTMVRVAGGVAELGTDDRSTAYDNERPRHRVELDPYWIDVHPVTNGEYLEFMNDGGYRRPELWSEEGWAEIRESGLEAPGYWEETGAGWQVRRMDRTGPVDPRQPVCHVGYWEADAFARWAGKRLPTEAEWEAAATWDPVEGRKHAYPWGDQAPDLRRANLDAVLFEPAPVGSYPLGVSPVGCWGMLGDVWEWTSTDFYGYPGYRTFPYPEYSEVFFGDEYKVLRGGSWATRPGAIRGTFRNWDFPIRRQIFSGFRCARDDG